MSLSETVIQKEAQLKLNQKLDFDNGNLANEHTRLTTLKKFIICGWTNTKTVRESTFIATERRMKTHFTHIRGKCDLSV